MRPKVVFKKYRTNKPHGIIKIDILKLIIKHLVNNKTMHWAFFYLKLQNKFTLPFCTMFFHPFTFFTPSVVFYFSINKKKLI